VLVTFQVKPADFVACSEQLQGIASWIRENRKKS
jgi:hypothetical protein